MTNLKKKLNQNKDIDRLIVEGGCICDDVKIRGCCVLFSVE